jgi:tetratricopeptide (TPR) repeat protein
MKACVMMAGCAILLLFPFTTISESLSPPLPPEMSPPSMPPALGEIPPTTGIMLPPEIPPPPSPTGVPPPPLPQSESERQMKKRQDELSRIQKLLNEGRDHDATGEWERVFAADPRVNTWENLAWELARAYLRLGQPEKAIAVYKPHYHFATESVEQRAELGEVLLFGEVVSTPTKVPIPIGTSHCLLCHGVSEDYRLSAPYLNLYGVVKRAKLLVASPQYQQRPKDTVQPEAFPGSGIATSVMEYLAESNVCPSCYVVPGYGNPVTEDRESRMPAVHKPPISLTIDEMVAIDTWLLKQEGEEIPSVGVMRAAYEKFLRTEDRPGSSEGIRLASLYDAKGDLEKAFQLLDENYAGVLPNESNILVGAGETSPGPPAPGLGDVLKLAQLREDPQLFVHLRQKPEIVAKYPKLLKADHQPSGLPRQ